MSAPPRPLVLASASPRRRELLARAGLRFEVDPAGVDEDFDPRTDPVQAALVLAERKARAVAPRWSATHLVLGADTLVVLDPEGPAPAFLGKPATPDEAAAMLGRLSGSRHAVITGLCALRVADGRVFLDHERTWVTMRSLSAVDVADYVASDEWRDKAGGYAIQESADRFVVALEEGGFDNVVGLPVERVRSLLRRAEAVSGGR